MELDEGTIIILGCIFPGLMTAVGALPIFFKKSISKKSQDTLLGAAAGVMLAATCFSLIMPSIEYGGGGVDAVLVTAAGILTGGVILDLIDRYAPHEHLIRKKVEGTNVESLKKIWLFVIAIAIHNFPEGLATGVGFGTENASNGVAVSVGIALQNMPEGLAVALSLVRENYSKKFAFLIAALTGLVEPIGAFLGYGLVSVFSRLVGLILAMAGGAMLFVISDEIIPETHSNGYERQATYGIIIGFIIMMIMDVLLGWGGIMKKLWIILLVLLTVSCGRAENESILDYRTEYIGDAARVSHIVDSQKYKGAVPDGIEIDSEGEPYGLKVNLKEDGDFSEDNLIKNASVTFALVENMSYVDYIVGEEVFSFKRSEAEEYLNEMNLNFDSLLESQEQIDKFLD